MRRDAIGSRPYAGGRTERERRGARFAAPGCELLRALDDVAATLGAVARRLLILGSTGSIGTQALDIVARSPDLELVGLSAERSWETLVEQAVEHRVARIA